MHTIIKTDGGYRIYFDDIETDGPFETYKQASEFAFEKYGEEI